MLPSRFQQIRKRTIAAVDSVFAEPVRISFLKDAEPDLDRPAVEISAVLRVGRGKQDPVSPGSASSKGVASTILTSSRSELWIDARRYSGPKLESGDVVTAIARKGEPDFEVLFVDDRDDNRIVAVLAEV